jgi:hypothetical protein
MGHPLDIKDENNSKSKVKSDGQECPSHTSRRHLGYFLGRDSGGTKPARR